MKELRVLALVPSPRDTSPGQRYRIEQWEPRLASEGVRIDFAPSLSPAGAQLLQERGRVVQKAATLLISLLKRVALVQRISGYDAVYIFRESAHIGPALVERVLAARRIPYVFDMDDAVWVRYVSPANSYYSFLRCPGKTATTCRLATEVIAGNSYLAAYAARYNGRVTVVPTTIDIDRYPPRHVPPTDPPIIGWTGSHSTIRYLEIIRPALECLRERMRFRMVVIGAQGPSPRGVDVEFRAWNPATEAEDLSDFAVGVMPLSEGEWERGKCGFKALQYMALGVPPVVSPVGTNCEVVEDGVSGCFARSSEEWETVLHLLLTNHELRGRLGVAARARVEASFSARVHAPRVAGVFREAAG